MKSLAEHLGIVDPQGNHDADEQAPEETLVVGEHITPQDFCRGILNSKQYRESILWRIRLGELPAAIESLLYHYAFGKPVDNVAITGDLSVTKIVREVVRAEEEEKPVEEDTNTIH